MRWIRSSPTDAKKDGGFVHAISIHIRASDEFLEAELSAAAVSSLRAQCRTRGGSSEKENKNQNSNSDCMNRPSRAETRKSMQTEVYDGQDQKVA